MIGVLQQAEDVLRARRNGAPAGDRPRRVAALAAVVIVFGMAYGAVMGSFAATGGEPRAVQMIYSSIKVPILLLVTFTLGLPSFFVVNTLLGLRDDFGQAVRALMATQAGLTIVLAAFGPFTALWYLSFPDYEGALLFNVAMFGLASLTAQFLLRRFYRPLVEKDRRHAMLLKVWLCIYAFVGIQMGWVLRPFVGHPRAETTFFRAGAWGNAYVEVFDTLRRFLFE